MCGAVILVIGRMCLLLGPMQRMEGRVSSLEDSGVLKLGQRTVGVDPIGRMFDRQGTGVDRYAEMMDPMAVMEG
jgi:hypothetical protein